ncbi:hypothetical protein [Amycolatopsis lurida]|uniref:hypothetical protein n=1 Tax=Amycolatopsis lurida TaxID=31959 RepID=UPI0036515636
MLGLSIVIACVAQFGVAGVPAELRDRLDAYRVLWPQEWDFFTGLDKHSVVAYQVGDDGRLSRLHERQIWDRQFAGLNREYDLYTNETWQIARRVPDRYWQTCGRAGEARCEKVPDLAAVYRMENQSGHPRLCGRSVIGVESTLPSAGGRAPDGPLVARRVVIVDLRCGH